MQKHLNLIKRIVGGLFAVLAIGGVQQATAQDIQFSQFYASSLFLNPAMAGIESNIAVNANFRSQWRTAVNPFLTTQVSGIYPFMGGLDGATQKGGAGLTFYNDYVGDGSLTRTGFMANGAYTLDMQLHKVSAGLQVGGLQLATNLEKQQWGEGYQPFSGYNSTYNALASDPNLRAGLNSRFVPLVNLGLMYSYNPGRSYYASGLGAHAGISAYNLNQPEISLSGANTKYVLPARINFHGGLDFFISPTVRFSPTVLVSMQKGFTQINGGGYLTFNVVPEGGDSFLAGSDLILGGYYRNYDAAIAMVGLSNSAYTFGVSYDVGMTGVDALVANRGALEISLAYRFVKENKRKRFDTPRI